MSTSDSVIDSALGLPAAERLDLADRLLESLAPERSLPDAFSEELAAEVQRRSAEMDSDEVPGVRWEDVRAKLDKRLSDQES